MEENITLGHMLLKEPRSSGLTLDWGDGQTSEGKKSVPGQTWVEYHSPQPSQDSFSLPMSNQRWHCAVVEAEFSSLTLSPPFIQWVGLAALGGAGDGRSIFNPAQFATTFQSICHYKLD